MKTLLTLIIFITGCSNSPQTNSEKEIEVIYFDNDKKEIDLEWKLEKTK